MEHGMNMTRHQGDLDWWNIWFYNDPVDTSRMKKIRMGFWVQSFNGYGSGND